MSATILFKIIERMKLLFWCTGTTPILEKTLREWRGQMKIFRVGSHQFWESLRELLREFWFWYCSSRGIPFREWNFVFREWNFEFRELLREYPGTLRELREWPFHSESVLSEIGGGPQASELFSNYFKVARLQREFWHEIFSWATNSEFLMKTLRNFPRYVRTFLVWEKKESIKIPARFTANFPCEKSKNSLTSFCRSAGRKLFKGLQLQLSGVFRIN